ncbi:hypothetical protein [Bacillus cereus group sp. BfR-BA-01380]|uniref:hypothetical protein n=1 Tax=Bacillus cereus group sp. BfR-BA-01380 TaxID=2920324 RepID=UPI001F561175|nr:hypothetical protein [Bacillus cereus group sp. BfR-BA-01380]
MNLKEIEKLPDRMPTGALALMFQNVLIELASENIDKQEFLLIFSQLTDRQVMTYELLENETRKQVDEVLCSLWNTDSYEDVDIILSIVVNLGLENCFAKIKQSITQNEKIDEMILNEILETIDEVGENISNPYHDLERYK